MVGSVGFVGFVGYQSSVKPEETLLYDVLVTEDYVPVLSENGSYIVINE